VDVASLLHEWWSWKRPSAAPTTIVVTESAIRFLVRDFGTREVNSLKVRDIDKWYSSMQARGYAVKYARRVMSVLSAAYSKGVRWEICDANPCLLAESPKNRSKVRALSPAVVRAALDFVRDRSLALYLFLRLAATTGARRSELLGLDRGDFAADVGLLTFRRVCTPGPGGQVIRDVTKTPRGARCVSLDPETCALLEKQLLSHNSAWVFPGRNAQQPMSPRTATRIVGSVGRELGVRLSPHLFRHYCATELLRRGFGLNVVASRLGDSPGTIASIYGHIVPADDARIASAIAATLTE
jgi:integrase